MLIVCAAVALACEREVAEPVAAVRPVRYQVVTATSATQPRSFAGVARAGVESRLSFRVSGTVDAVPVSRGDSVVRGQTLARLDPTDFELHVEEAEAAVAQGQAGLRRAEADYERVRSLYESNNASKSELDASRATAESAQAQVDAVRKQLEQARQQLAYTTLRAPVAGAIADVDVEVNENVTGGQGIFLLTSGAQPEVEVAVPGSRIGAIEVGQRVLVNLDAFPNRFFRATISEVGVAATRAATTFGVTARIEEPDAGIRSGMAAEVTFRFANPLGGDRILVSAVAVGEDSDGRHVFVLASGADGTTVVRRRPVTIGALEAEGLEIVSGLEDGERVVTAGVRRLADGLEVQLLDTTR